MKDPDRASPLPLVDWYLLVMVTNMRLVVKMTLILSAVDKSAHIDMQVYFMKLYEIVTN